MAHAFHTSIDKPLTITKAMGRDTSWKNWKEAMKSKFQSLIDNKTWELVPLPRVVSQLVVNGFSKSNTMRMDWWSAIRLDSWHWDTYKKKV